ncbi:hypothetical protein ACIRQQ_48925 [Streptomyces fuscichromogenes]|uniref:hypothetical protein n=1 Tax=Streptomyces fuscichromogenes TaxID=1324013 RepID=UPI003818AB68
MVRSFRPVTPAIHYAASPFRSNSTMLRRALLMSCFLVMAAANSAESAATRSAISLAYGESAGMPACR